VNAHLLYFFGAHSCSMRSSYAAFAVTHVLIVNPSKSNMKSAVKTFVHSGFMNQKGMSSSKSGALLSSCFCAALSSVFGCTVGRGSLSPFGSRN